jgi:putative FmdB family regulatory protein
MPIYEYECRACGHRFESLVFGSERPECPACGAKEPEKRLSSFAVSTAASKSRPEPGSCGTCGDPRGPGACDLD